MKIVIVGDVMLGRLVNDYMRQVSPDYFWGDTLPLIMSADFSLINLECALTKSATPWTRTPKVFHFRADPAPAIAVLKAARISAVDLANNHVLDYETDGLQETLRTLRDAGIPCCGAGLNIHEAAAPAVVDVAGIRVAVIGATDNLPEWLATTDTPGVNYVEITPEGAARLAEAVRTARAAADLLILSLHWGPNMRQRPADAFIRFAHEMLDAGADIIHGHSAHIFQGLEIYR
ncbi:MAG TPA: CapA family protein, partial [Planctomycetota bacterium]|nr:CapA family protein [Planctomycetota bacterium]